MSLTLLVIIESIADPAFHIESVALVYILLHHLCKTTEEHEVMPIGMIWYLHTISQGVTFLRCRKRHLSYRLICIIIMHNRFLAHITNQHYLIHSFLIIIFLLPHSQIAEMEILTLS